MPGEGKGSADFSPGAGGRLAPVSYACQGKHTVPVSWLTAQDPHTFSAQEHKEIKPCLSHCRVSKLCQLSHAHSPRECICTVLQ